MIVQKYMIDTNFYKMNFLSLNHMTVRYGRTVALINNIWFGGTTARGTIARYRVLERQLLSTRFQTITTNRWTKIVDHKQVYNSAFQIFFI
jgi:hypothetical protein